MNLTGASFDNCAFAGTDFTDAVITRTRFFTGGELAPADELTLDQIQSTWNYKHGRMKGIQLPESIAKALAEEEP